MSKMLKFDIRLQRKEFLLDVQATVNNGITGVYGPSGHGKSSLLNSIAGLVKPDAGCITIRDEKVFNSEQKINLPVQKRNVGYVFQDIRLFPHLTIEKNLKYGIKKGTNAEINFNELVDILNVSHLLAKKPSECSGGEKQRIAIGRALLSGARILLMDEPFSAVDVNLRNNIIPFLKAINLRFHIPMLVVSHDLPDLLSLTSDLLLLKEGKVKALGRFQDLILDESNLDMVKGAGLYNVFDLCVVETLPLRSMVLLQSRTSDFQVQVLQQMLSGEVKEGVPVKVLIRPEDISISLHAIPQISLRNQIKGRIDKIFSRNGLSFCMVDAGEKVLVEITEASRENMELEEGTTVYCLFKSAALKIF
ncbi:molybdenum ABC transporter ATP-binding protein [Maribellus sp. CM-23]|uniref:molybdenum ABC transporter ATP-binding protein n=1 Tax=Maribellus sp. CM-23 TaxID=2781026 RepID=UPI001F1BB747|nr:molybdenum ABC transporter ATP-binding protein [Maribellus sp. CM-23]MCE4567015.1 molybdenum ABC transporter ATP-binding protein [Maribellus sp. CM-23]